MLAEKAILPVVEEDDEITNKSGNRPFEDVLRVNVSRRGVLAGGLGLMSTTILAGHPSPADARGRGPRINFSPVTLADAAASDGTVPLISDDYFYEVLIPWGTPLSPGVDAYEGDPNTRPTSAEQAEMVGIGHDGMTYFPMGSSDDDDDEDDDYEDDDDGGRRRGLSRFRRRRSGNRRGVLAINHEFGRNTHILGKSAPENLEDVRLSQNGHGVGLVEIKEKGGTWEPVLSKLSRRVTVNTPVAFSGPVADTSYLDNEAGNEPLGTVNNCANGETPWGTYLTCEENFNLYFNAESFTASESDTRYGLSDSPNQDFYSWWRFDERFDLDNPAYANERNRFGWVVEIDPFDPEKKPIKRTALGRIKHENVALVVGRGGRVVCYMGDDQRFDYIYKFVSAGNWRKMLAEGKSPLDEGTLYVARFNDDGSGDWLPLTMDNPDLAGEFADQAELLVNTRLAADKVGATPMDRPEWIAVLPNRDVYCTLTNNSQRTQPEPPNPEAPNINGHIIRWRDTKKFTGESFTWDIFIIASTTEGTEESFASPDGLGADEDSRLFIQTDGGQQDPGLQDQMLVANPKTGEIRRLFMGVASDEITGQAMTPDRRTMFINVQHPGNGDPTRTNFPVVPADGVTIPRDCTIVLRRKDGGIIGS